MAPEMRQIQKVLEGWVAGSASAEEILQRVSDPDGVVAKALGRWVARRGGIPAGVPDPDALRLGDDPARDPEAVVVDDDLDFEIVDFPEADED